MQFEKIWTEILLSLTTFTNYNYTTADSCREACSSSRQSLLTLRYLELAGSTKFFEQLFSLSTADLTVKAVYLDVEYDWNSKLQIYDILPFALIQNIS